MDGGTIVSSQNRPWHSDMSKVSHMEMGSMCKGNTKVRNQSNCFRLLYKRERNLKSILWESRGCDICRKTATSSVRTECRWKNALVTLKTEKGVATISRRSGQEVQELHMKNKNIMGAKEESGNSCGIRDTEVTLVHEGHLFTGTAQASHAGWISRVIKVSENNPTILPEQTFEL